MTCVRAGTVLGLLVLGSIGCGGGGGSDDGTGPDPDAVASVVVTPSAASLAAIGATASFSAQARNSSGTALSGKTFTWSSTSAGVASVSASGVVTAAGNGTTTIRATVSGGSVSGTATVTVQQVVSAISVTPTANNIVVGGTVQLAATATDAGGAPIASPGLSWTTSNGSIATVSNTGLVTGVSAGSATITATSGSVSAQAAVTVALPNLSFGQDSSISGNIAVNTITIPAGRTVTVTGALTLAAEGMVTIAGTLVGSCVPFDVVGDTAVTITGTVANGCDNGTPANLRIAATGELELDGATITSSGDITLSNDPSLSETSFSQQARAWRAAAQVAAAQPGVKFTRVNNSTVKYHGNQGPGAGPNPAKNGTDGVTGTKGDDGRPVKMFLDGNAIFAGSTTLWGQDGGAGGNGVAAPSLTNLTTTGGAGGKGGKISVFITGKLTYEGSDNVVRAGRGGKGGNATATTLENSGNGPKGPNATANAGAGGEPGVVDIRAGQGIEIKDAGALQIELVPGVGGDATATGAPGAKATALMPAQEGGDGTATGGKGGDTPNARLTAAGVTGAPVIIADGANGGTATATGGKGGDGEKPNKDGAMGGKPTATGGNGGNAQTRNQLNVLIGMGGNGGDATRIGGNGGHGWADCVVGQEEPGGAGGDGASVGAVTRGLGGTGDTPGQDGDNTYQVTGNGGNGGRGAGPGGGGRGGTGPGALGAGDAITPPSFTDGTAGVDCTPAPEPDIDVDMGIVLPVMSGVVPPGTYLWTLLDQVAQVIGSIPVEAAGPAGNTFTAQSPTRIGWSTSGSWIFDLASAVVDGLPFDVSMFSICFINSDLDAGHPALIEELDALGQVIATTEVTATAADIVGQALPAEIGCPEVQLQAGTKKARISKTGKGSFADGRRGKLRGKKHKN